MFAMKVYNPGQGYQYLRGAWHKIDHDNVVPSNYRKYLPAGVSTAEELRRYVDGTYPDQKTWVDEKNPFYDVVLDSLISTVRNQATKT